MRIIVISSLSILLQYSSTISSSIILLQNKDGVEIMTNVSLAIADKRQKETSWEIPLPRPSYASTKSHFAHQFASVIELY